MPVLLPSILTPLFLSSSPVPLSYFILAVLMRECLGKHSCMSSPFPIAILNVFTVKGIIAASPDEILMASYQISLDHVQAVRILYVLCNFHS